MSVNFNLLDPNMPANIAGSVYAGQQQQQQNQLAKQQLQQSQMQTEKTGMDIQKMRSDQAALQKMQQAFVANGKSPDLESNFNEMIQSGIPHFVDIGTKGLQTLQAQKQFAAIMGGPSAAGAAPAAPAAAPEVGGNALAPTAPVAAAPVNALAPKPEIAAMRLKRDQLLAMGTTQAIAAARALDADIALASKAPVLHVVGKSLVGAEGKPIYTEPEKAAEPSSLVELKAYMKMTPAERADFEKLQKIKATNVTATATSTTPTAKSLAAPVGARAETSLAKAEGATGIMDSANMVREALNAGNVIAGPLAGVRTKFAQVLELAGAGDKEKLVNTRTAIQGLATLTLESRAELKGQGQVTENEQKLLERARSGNVEDMTIAELQQVVNVSQRLANRLWSSHQTLLKTMETDPAAVDSIRYYRPTTVLPSAVGEGKPKAETDKRTQGLDKIFKPQQR